MTELKELESWITKARNANTHVALLRGSGSSVAAVKTALERREQARAMAKLTLEKLLARVN